jgi:hypothetical protein
MQRVEENEQDHSQERMERCAKKVVQKRKKELDRADIVRDVRLTNRALEESGSRVLRHAASVLMLWLIDGNPRESSNII